MGVAIGDCLDGCAGILVQGMGIGGLADDITRVVVGIHPGLPCPFVILPNQLIVKANSSQV